MAQTKKKRSRKHRGSPAGTVNRPARTGQSKGQSKKDPKQASRDRRVERMNREPTWKGSINRAAIAALVFGVIVAVVKSNPVQGAGLAVLMFFIYIPLGFMTDRAVYNFRRRKRG